MVPEIAFETKQSISIHPVMFLVFVQVRGFRAHFEDVVHFAKHV